MKNKDQTAASFNHPFHPALCALLITGFMLAGSHGVQAQTIVQTRTLDFSLGLTQDLSFDLFDTLNGRTLDSVTYNITLNSTGGQFAVDNDSATSTNVTLTRTATISDFSSSDLSNFALLDTSAAAIGSGIDISSEDSASLTGTTGDDTENFNNTGGTDFFGIDPLPDASDSSTQEVFSGGLSEYTSDGPGTFTLSVTADQDTDVSIDGGATVRQSSTTATFTGEVEIIYAFTPIPEPDSLPLMLLSFGVLYILRNAGKKASHPQGKTRSGD